MYESTEFWYNIIIVRELLMALVIYIKLSNNNIAYRKGSYEGRTSPMVYLNKYDFEPLKRKYGLTCKIPLLLHM